MAAKGKVLVLVSSGRGLPLKDGKVYTGAGYYLDQLDGSGSRPDGGRATKSPSPTPKPTRRKWTSIQPSPISSAGTRPGFRTI